jgi:diguanylate cyclase (GGDEF)-like protein
MVHFEVTLEGLRRKLDGGNGHLLIVDADSGAVVIDNARPQEVGKPLGDPDNGRFTMLVGQWQDQGQVYADGRQVAYHRVPSAVGNDNRWYVVSVAPAAPGPLTGVEWLSAIVALTATLIIAYTLVRLHKSRSALVRAANTDPLTGLHNRRRLEADLAALLPKCTVEDPLYLTLSDLNGFKAFNDTLGHPAGDALLQAVARRLREGADASATTARLGGDEFGILLPGDDRAAVADSAADLIARISEPYEVDGHIVIIGASIGIAFAPENGVDPDQLIKRADLALYRAKAEGRGTWRFYAAAMDEDRLDRRRLDLVPAEPLARRAGGARRS